MADELATLMVGLTTDNPTWGYPRIQGELLNLGSRVAARTIARVRKTHGIEPAPRPTSTTGRQLLRRPAAGIVAGDFFSVDTVSRRRLSVPCFIHHRTRRVFLAAMTTNPTRDGVTPCARHVTADLRDPGAAVRYLLGDRDGTVGPSVDAVWPGEGASVLRRPVRAPHANAVAERWVHTGRSECTDRLLVVHQGHLRRVLDRDVRHFNDHRPHRGLALRPPLQPASSRPAQSTSIRRQEVLGGLINEYHAA
jgi:putative transposase